MYAIRSYYVMVALAVIVLILIYSDIHSRDGFSDYAIEYKNFSLSGDIVVLVEIAQFRHLKHLVFHSIFIAEIGIVGNEKGKITQVKRRNAHQC